MLTLLKILMGAVVFLTAFLGTTTVEKNIGALPSPEENLETIATSTLTHEIATTSEPMVKTETIPAPTKPVEKPPQVETKTTVTNPLPLPVKTEPEIIEFDKINERARAAIVNIFCTSSGNTLNPLTASGVFIDSKGVILTNAHVGQYFLFPEYVNCIIRTGSPARETYRAKLLYISEEWIKNNAQNIKKTNPTGTGENDYAFLLVTSSTSNINLPSSFPSLNLFTGSVTLDEYMLLASYPAEFLGGISVSQNLYAASSVARVSELFTFKNDTVDLFSIGTTVVSQKGSSGGVAVNKDSLLAGLIVTATESIQTADRDLRAISMNHISQSLVEETGKDLTETLSQASLSAQQNFEISYAPLLKKILLDQLQTN